MTTIQRSYLELIKSRLFEPIRQIQVLAGPRQVGKTTLVRQVLEVCQIPNKYVSADAIAAGDQGWLDTIWNEARVFQKANNSTYILAIDEIQKVFQWSEKVKQLWDEDRANNQSIHVILLGSSRLLLQQGLTESLAGRFELIHIPHWRFSEMNSAFGFTPEEYAWFGSYPGAANLITDEIRWKNYVRESLIETAISKDLLMLTRVDKPALLRNLFELGSNYSGQILSYTKLIGQLQDAGNTTTLAHYLRLLDGAGLLTGLPKFAIDAARTKSSSPRFQVFNNALMNCYSHQNFSEAKANPELWGRVVESAVGTHLLTYRAEGIEIFYYREGADEVDYILTYKGKFIALEIKTAKQQTKGLSKFISKFSPHRNYLISPEGITWQELIKLNPAELF
ncbi:MAG: AAA family ATPase [Bacteroidetes bacterium B1(2017)]|nr:MAG: AAA family ATPase [Bacteroidetes bacterium B1(2017)]